MTCEILPIEVEIVNTAKEVMREMDVRYVRKYSHAQVRKGQPTGKRSHKFFGLITGAQTPEEVMAEMNAAIYFISPYYAAFMVYSPFHNYPSITIRPIR
jgi:hypothetical protein